MDRDNTGADIQDPQRMNPNDIIRSNFQYFGLQPNTTKNNHFVFSAKLRIYTNAIQRLNLEIRCFCVETKELKINVDVL